TQQLSQSIITFKNEEQLALKESYYVMEKQMYRTATCMLAFTQQSTRLKIERKISNELHQTTQRFL
ncbi:competence protein ComK, partial [Aquibacillus salsiterrae]